MRLQQVLFQTPQKSDYNTVGNLHANSTSFKTTLRAVINKFESRADEIVFPKFTLIPQHLPDEIYSEKFPIGTVISSYMKNNGSSKVHISDIEKYKEDQLLSNPGGDNYYLDQKRIDNTPDLHSSFIKRVGKDLSDAFQNIRNFFQDLLFGSTICHRAPDGSIKQHKRRGLLSAIGDFFKDLGSALTFGAWRPDGDPEPKGFFNRIKFFFSKVKEAIFGDLVQGIGQSIVHMGEDILFSVLNLLEVIPDATIGNLKAGRRIITTVFDNAQVVLDYLTDIVPFGDAWIRVHSMKGKRPPILYNLTLPEHFQRDERWSYIRNTPFRKAIETVGSLFSDLLLLKLIGNTKLISNDHHENRNPEF
jgi:hypothetical protein